MSKPLALLLDDGGLADHFGAVACGPYLDAPDGALLLPLTVLAPQGMPALIVAGASSRLPIDDEYRTFYRLIGVTIASAISAVRAREEAR